MLLVKKKRRVFGHCMPLLDSTSREITGERDGTKVPSPTQTGDIVVHSRHLKLNVTPKPRGRLNVEFFKCHFPMHHNGILFTSIVLGRRKKPTLNICVFTEHTEIKSSIVLQWKVSMGWNKASCTVPHIMIKTACCDFTNRKNI